MVAIIARVLHVGALAPLSIVQSVLSGGLVFLAVLGERFFRLRLGRRQWVGVTITAAGLVVIELPAAAPLGRSTLTGGADQRRVRDLRYRHRASGDVSPPPRSAQRRRTAPRLGRRGHCSASLMSDSSTSPTPPDRLHRLVSPWTLTALIAGAISSYATARSLQLGPGRRGHRPHIRGCQPHRDHRRHPRLDEPIGSGPLAIGARFLAFRLVIGGAALMPAHRTEGREPAEITLPIITTSQTR
jgi:hypothetical protein